MLCRCLEGLFDTWGTFGTTFNNNLALGGPTPIGARKANLSAQAYAYIEEVALNEQVRSFRSSVGQTALSTTDKPRGLAISLSSA